jgi:HNH endonuclease/AP2 domain
MDKTDLRELLREARRLFAYDPNTGTITRRVSIANTKVGAIAGCFDPLHRRLRVQFNGKHWSIHRLAWFIHYGVIPSLHIDHINGDRLDNRLENLRLATDLQNMHNCPKTSRNKSGYKGVHWDKWRNSWRATIRVNGKSIKLGRFDDPALAHKAYCAAADRYFKEFANHG